MLSLWGLVILNLMRFLLQRFGLGLEKRALKGVFGLDKNYMNFLYTRVHSDFGAIPSGVKAMIFGLFVYMIAWGIIDPFFSIILHQVINNYSMTGFVYGGFFLVGAIFSAPVGCLADKVNQVRFTVFAIFTYPLVSLFYLSAFFFPTAISFIVLFLARLLNGTCALFWVMAESFIRKNSPKGETSATFGLYITFQRLAYVIAPLIIIPLVLYFGLTFENLHWLLLAIIPFSLLSGLMISRIKDEGGPIMDGIKEMAVKENIVRKELDDLKQIGIMGWLCMLLAFFMRSLESILIFLMPLYALSINLSIVELSVLFGAISIPFLFSFFLAELSDRYSKAGIICIGFLLSAVTLIALALSAPSHPVLIGACFVLGLLLATLQPAVNGLITDITPRMHDGEITGIYMTVIMISGFLSATAIGMLCDLVGLTFPFIALGVILIGLALSTFALRSKIVVRI